MPGVRLREEYLADKLKTQSIQKIPFLLILKKMQSKIDKLKPGSSTNRVKFSQIMQEDHIREKTEQAEKDRADRFACTQIQENLD